jgi:hypothetical protein
LLDLFYTDGRFSGTNDRPGEGHTSQFDFALAHPETFAVYVRIPAWIEPKTSVSVNGRKIENEVVPGKILALQRTSKDGDRLGLEFETGSCRSAKSEQRRPDAWSGCICLPQARFPRVSLRSNCSRFRERRSLRKTGRLEPITAR